MAISRHGKGSIVEVLQAALVFRYPCCGWQPDMETTRNAAIPTSASVNQLCILSPFMLARGGATPNCYAPASCPIGAFSCSKFCASTQLSSSISDSFWTRLIIPDSAILSGAILFLLSSIPTTSHWLGRPQSSMFRPGFLDE
jgi:hypothetical protein